MTFDAGACASPASRCAHSVETAAMAEMTPATPATTQTKPRAGRPRTNGARSRPSAETAIGTMECSFFSRVLRECHEFSKLKARAKL